ncbi:MAG: ABC transporter substrate-binding protein [Firmicutes bacterium]|nr:ABC transporter substrate-binding protein [Bacillota bacterium]
MKNTRNRIVAGLLALLLMFSMTACGGGSSGDGGGEVIFNVATSGGYDTFNFFTTESSMVYDWLNITYDSLITYDEDYNAIPRVATDWTEEDNVWTFHLRDDVYFSDGEQLTSADVKWTYENAIDSYMYSLHASGFVSIECPDDFTVVFTCENAKPDMLYQIISILPEHIWSGVEDVFNYEPNEVIGSGPFIYSPERSGNGSIAFVKNADYWGDVPVIDVLVFTEYDNYDAIAQALKLGEVDAAYSLEKTQLDSLSGTPGIEAGAYGSFDFEYMGYNLLDELCADKTIRHAIDYCVDKELAVEMSYGGLAEVAYGAVSNEGFIYTPAEKRDLDIAKANELLDNAGYGKSKRTV